MDGLKMLKMENPIKMDDLGVALFLETPSYFGTSSPPGVVARHAVPVILRYHRQSSELLQRLEFSRHQLCQRVDRCISYLCSLGTENQAPSRCPGTLHTVDLSEAGIPFSLLPLRVTGQEVIVLAANYGVHWFILAFYMILGTIYLIPA